MNGYQILQRVISTAMIIVWISLPYQHFRQLEELRVIDSIVFLAYLFATKTVVYFLQEGNRFD